MNGLGGGIVSFRLKEDIHGLTRDQVSRKFVNSLKLTTIATSLVDRTGQRAGGRIR